MKRFGWLAIVVAAAMIVAEFVARIVFNFPLYDMDNQVGYWPKAEQSGTFLLTHDWTFNKLGLGVAEEFAPSTKFDVLLVGDSIVYGGNPYKQAEKLGPVLERQTGWQVWSASAGSWAVQNELAFLRRHPELPEGADSVVFVFNSGDFTKPSEWRSQYTHPREYPRFYLLYLFERYVLRPAPGPAPAPVAQRDVLADWLAFADRFKKPIYVVAYSTPKEAGQACNWVPAAFKEVGSWYCYDGVADVGTSGYIDGMHPTPQANQVIAERIAGLITGSRTMDQKLEERQN